MEQQSRQAGTGRQKAEKNEGRRGENVEGIYLDSAATSYYRPKEVAEAVAGAIGSMGNCSRGTYSTVLESARVIVETRQLINELVDGDGAQQVAFTANSTESLNMAIKGILKPGDKAVTTVMEHNSVLRPLYQLEQQGVEVVRVGCRYPAADEEIAEKERTTERVRVRRSGLLDMEALYAAIGPGVKAVICTHASNLTGNVLDIRGIGKRCREVGAVFIVDASQTAGVLPISMKECFIDILCFTGHKGLMGPQGTGGICVRKGIVLEPLLTGGSGIQTFSKTHPAQMPEALEAGTLNGHGIAGLRAALLWIKKQGGPEVIYRKETDLARKFYQMARDIPGICFYGDYAGYEQKSDRARTENDGSGESGRIGTENDGNEESGNYDQRSGLRIRRVPMVTLNLGDADSGEVSDWLAWEHGIATRSGGHCAPLMHRALGTEEQGAVRFSFSSFNTIEQAVRAAEALREFVDL